MTSFSSLPCATKLQVFIPTSEHFSSFAMSDLLRRDVLRLRASSRVGSTERKFREHESRRFAEMCQRGHLFPFVVAPMLTPKFTSTISSTMGPIARVSVKGRVVGDHAQQTRVPFMRAFWESAAVEPDDQRRALQPEHARGDRDARTTGLSRAGGLR